MKRVVGISFTSFILFFCSMNNIYAHGEHMLAPFSADLIVLLLGFIILFKPHTGWKYRIAIIIGALFSIYLSWYIIGYIWPDYYFRVLRNTFLMACAYYIIVITLFACVYFFSEKYIKNKK